MPHRGANGDFICARRRGAHRRVYFEEWDDPRITAIEWVGELIEIAGGENIFADRPHGNLAAERFIDDDEVCAGIFFFGPQ